MLRRLIDSSRTIADWMLRSTCRRRRDGRASVMRGVRSRYDDRWVERGAGLMAPWRKYRQMCTVAVSNDDPVAERRGQMYIGPGHVVERAKPGARTALVLAAGDGSDMDLGGCLGRRDGELPGAPAVLGPGHTDHDDEGVPVLAQQENGLRLKLRFGHTNAGRHTSKECANGDEPQQ